MTVSIMVQFHQYHLQGVHLKTHKNSPAQHDCQVMGQAKLSTLKVYFLYHSYLAIRG